MSKLQQHLSTRIDSFIEHGFEKHKSLFNVVGAHAASAASLFLSQSFSKEIMELPRLVVVSSLDEALKFKQFLEFFSPNFRAHVFQSYDVSLFSGLFPSPETRNSRTRFLYWAANAQKNDIFIAPVSSLLQLSVPFFHFSKRCKKMQPGDELPSDLSGYLNSLGYQASPVVEDVGQYSLRGGIVDLFSPAEEFPVRIELFGDQIESMRKFSIVDQRSLEEISSFSLIPIYEFELSDENIESIIKKLRDEYRARGVTPSEADEAIRSISLKNYFSGCELLLPYCYDKLSSPLDHFSSDLNLLFLDPPDVSRAADEWIQELENDFRLNRDNTSLTFGPDLNSVLQKYESIDWGSGSRILNFSNLSFLNDEAANEERINYSTLPLTEFSLLAQNMT
ncbi:MAG: transcription-repair coupling factor, partial [Pseudobdellovibrio sp.]